MKITAEPRSDQYNADDFVGSGSRTFTIAGCIPGRAEQKYDIQLAGEDRVWRPPLTVLRLLMNAWGDETDEWIGHRVTLYRDETVTFGKDATGGVRISHMSHISQPIIIASTVSRGKRKPSRIDPLPDEPAPTRPPAKAPTAASIIGAFDSLGVTVEQLETRIGHSNDAWTADDIAQLAALGKAIKAGATTTFEEFEQPEEPVQDTLDTAGDGE